MSINNKNFDYLLLATNSDENPSLIKKVGLGIKAVGFPVGMIMMWKNNVSDIPFGWKLCDGSEYNNVDGTVRIKTPDLRGLFVVGPNSSTTKKGQDVMISSKSEPISGSYTEIINDSSYVYPIHSHTVRYDVKSYSSKRLAYTQTDMYNKSANETSGSNEGTPENPVPYITVRPTNTSLYYIIRVS